MFRLDALLFLVDIAADVRSAWIELVPPEEWMQNTRTHTHHTQYINNRSHCNNKWLVNRNEHFCAYELVSASLTHCIIAVIIRVFIFSFRNYKCFKLHLPDDDMHGIANAAMTGQLLSRISCKLNLCMSILSERWIAAAIIAGAWMNSSKPCIVCQFCGSG